MKVVFMGNNRLGLQVVEELQASGVDIVGAVLHPVDRSRHREALVELLELPEERVLDGPALRTPQGPATVKEWQADICVSALFDYVLRPDVLTLFPRGCVNLHPSYLPYNRGQYPNVWSIIEGTPAGATLHYMDETLDTGDIIAQKRVAVDPHDTGESLYRKLEKAAIELFSEAWPEVRDGRDRPVPQIPGDGTYHRTRDVDAIDEIDLTRTYAAGELIDVLRARTFPPYPGAFFRTDEGRVYLRLELIPETRLES